MPILFREWKETLRIREEILFVALQGGEADQNLWCRKRDFLLPRVTG